MENKNVSLHFIVITKRSKLIFLFALVRVCKDLLSQKTRVGEGREVREKWMASDGAYWDKSNYC